MFHVNFAKNISAIQSRALLAVLRLLVKTRKQLQNIVGQVCEAV
jgi:hypothetical protein